MEKIFKLVFGDNKKIELPKCELLYADCIYESRDFEWVEKALGLIKEGGIFILQTDYHTVAEYKILLDSHREFKFLNWIIYKQEWGGYSKRFFPRKHDDILIYARGNNYKFYYERILIPKKTAGSKLDKNGGLKIPCDVFDDLKNFSTISKERIKDSTGKSYKWQKPLKLYDRLFLPFTDEGDLIIDFFMGSGSVGEWCLLNNRNYIGIEIDEETFNLAKRRLSPLISL